MVLKWPCTCYAPDYSYLSEVPVLGLHPWDQEAIDRVTSVIGTSSLIFMYFHITGRLNLIFARTCAEVDTREELPDSLPIQIEENAMEYVPVQYAWKPTFLGTCKSFGHDIKFVSQQIARGGDTKCSIKCP